VLFLALALVAAQMDQDYGGYEDYGATDDSLYAEFAAKQQQGEV
jgi:hypothetical protein